MLNVCMVLSIILTDKRSAIIISVFKVCSQDLQKKEPGRFSYLHTGYEAGNCSLLLCLLLYIPNKPHIAQRWPSPLGRAQKNTPSICVVHPMRQVLVCGIPGTGTQDACEATCELNKSIASFPMIHFNFEHLMCCQASSDQKGDVNRETPQSLIEVLSLPRPKLILQCENSWKQYFDNQRTQQPAGISLLSAHLTYWLPTRYEFLHNELPQALCKKGLFEKIIVLIDDIYDIHAHLHKKHYFPYPHDLDSYNKLSVYREQYFPQYLAQLQIVLNWRQQEITAAKSLGHQLGTEVYLFSVKHSQRGFHQLLDFDRTRASSFYLCHPITRPRKDKLESETSSEFIHGLEVVSRTLAQDYLLFLPTTIDELRFDTIAFTVPGPVKLPRKPPSWERAIPSLTKRWPIEPGIKTLRDSAIEYRKRKSLREGKDFKSPVDFIRIFLTLEDHEREFLETLIWNIQNEINKGVRELGSLDTIFNDALELSINEDSGISPSRLAHILGNYTSGLIDTINHQITSRDYDMVDQADHIFAYRPFFVGETHHGVTQEIKHYESLLAGKGKIGRIIRFMPTEDSVRAIPDRLFNVVTTEKPDYYSEPIEPISDNGEADRIGAIWLGILQKQVTQIEGNDNESGNAITEDDIHSLFKDFKVDLAHTVTRFTEHPLKQLANVRNALLKDVAPYIPGFRGAFDYYDIYGDEIPVKDLLGRIREEVEKAIMGRVGQARFATNQEDG